VVSDVQGDTGTGTTGSGGTPPGGSGWTPPGSADPALAGKEAGAGSGSALAPLLLADEAGLRNNSNPRVRVASGGLPAVGSLLLAAVTQCGK
jgi:hypothetical protein